MFCKFCGAQQKDDSVFCMNCGQKLAVPNDRQPPDMKGATASSASTESTQPQVPPQPKPLFSQHVNRSEVQRSIPATPHKSSGGKIAASVVAVVIVLGCVIGGAYTAIHNQKEHQRELQAAQDQIAEAQAAAEQAQSDAEVAQTEREQAKAEAEQSKKDAEVAQKEADQAKSDAAALILAAINAARDGDAIAYDGYIFPSDREYVKESDMYYWDQTITLLARNEIYARHGYVFQTPYIQDYFGAQSWYYPDSSYKGAGLSKVEQSNVDTILAYEKKMGWQ